MGYSLSVIIPMYNREQTIGKALESVLRQSLKNIEVIVVDDGSTDESVDVVRKYQKKQSNLCLFFSEHKGPGAARNIGIQHAHGEYIAFLDSDDWVPEMAYQAMYQVAVDRNADVIIGKYLRKINGGKWIPAPATQILLTDFGKCNCAGKYKIPIKNPSCWNKLIRRNFILDHNVEFPEAMMAEDLFFSITLFDFATQVYMIDEVVYMYESDTRVQNSIISKPDPKSISDGIEILKRLGMRFHEQGMIDEQALNLEESFRFILSRFWDLPDSPKKNALFENIKEYLYMYKDMKEYRLIIESLFHMELETLLLLPFPTYARQILLISSPQKTVSNNTRAPTTVGNPKEAVLKMYQQGEIGFRFIIKYFAAWLKYKIKGK